MNKYDSKPDYQIWAATLKSCAANTNIRLGKCFHSVVLKLGLHSCLLVSKSLLNMYAKCRAFDDCRLLFDQITHPDAVTWNIMLSGLAGTRIHDSEVVKLYKSMSFGQNHKANSVTVAIVLPVCVRFKGLSLGKSVHSYVIKSGLECQTLVGNALVSMYLKLGCVSGDADQVFDEMTERDVVSWNAMVAGLVENGLILEAFMMFRQMIVDGTSPNYATIANILPVCGLLESNSSYWFGKEIHCYSMRREDLVNDVSVVNSLVGFYSKIGQMHEAESLFERTCSKNLVSWNSMIAGYTSNGEWLKGFKLFQEFISLNLTKPDSVTFLTLLPTCANLKNLQAGKQLHGYILRHHSLHNVTSLGNSLVNFYSKCGDPIAAFRSFSMIHKKDLISWNSILDALAEGRLVTEFLRQLRCMFREGVKPDSITVATAVQLGADVLQVGMVKEAHGFSLRSNLFLGNTKPTVSNTLMDAYARCQNMDYAAKIFVNAKMVFANMNDRDLTLTTWNLMIRSYVENGYLDQALNLFSELQNYEMKPDIMTIMSVLPVSTRMVSVKMLSQCHGYIVRACFQDDVQLTGAFLDAYSKCGNINSACKLFDSTRDKDLVMFTSMVGGYAMHGMGKEALEVYFNMLKNGGKPDHVIITSVLSACSHNGLVNEGLKIFDSIKAVHGMEPTMEQYACVVDLLARNRRISDAYSFITSMPVGPNANIWGVLLGACRNQDDVEMGCVVADCFLKIEDTTTTTTTTNNNNNDNNNMGNYVVMSNIYAAKEKWERVVEIRRLMKTKDLKKPAGCSWIEVDGRKSVFLAGDTSHPLRRCIINTLCNLAKQVEERFQQG